MFLDTVFTVLGLYTFALLITCILMIATEKKDDSEHYQKRVTEFSVFAIGAAALLGLSMYVI